MKLLLIFILIFAVLSCTSKKITLIQNEEPYTATIPDSLTNYFLFDYIDSLSEKVYKTKLDSIKNGLSIDFFTLRMAYTFTKEYLPYGSDLDDSLKKANNYIESAKYNSAITLINKIQTIEYVNIPSHLYLGFIYGQLGDSIKSKFHYNIYDGLLNSIYQSGDGRTPQTAYIVISIKEEYQFLHWFNFQVRGQSRKGSDGYSFDLMSVTDPNTNDDLEIYFNIELAFSRLRDAFSK